MDEVHPSASALIRLTTAIVTVPDAVKKRVGLKIVLVLQVVVLPLTVVVFVMTTHLTIVHKIAQVNGVEIIFADVQIVLQPIMTALLLMMMELVVMIIRDGPLLEVD